MNCVSELLLVPLTPFWERALSLKGNELVDWERERSYSEEPLRPEPLCHPFRAANFELPQAAYGLTQWAGWRGVAKFGLADLAKWTAALEHWW